MTNENDPGMVRWSRINDEPFEYAIQQGTHGDEFVKLLNGAHLRRPIADAYGQEARNRLLRGLHGSAV